MVFRKIFSASEEEIIGKFLISCWKKKLRVPHDTLYDTLAKHLEKFPRPSKCKDNRPSSIWRLKFFERNPFVQEAYNTYKATASKTFDVVSEQLLSSFLQNLELAEMPTAADRASNLDDDLPDAVDEYVQQTTPPKIIPVTRRGVPIIKVKPKKKKPVSTATESKKIEEKPKKRVRSKTVEPGKGSDSSKTGKRAEKDGKKKSRGSFGGLKLSSILFTPGKTPTSKGSQHSEQSSTARESKQNKKSVGSPVVSSGKAKQGIPADAVPLAPVKFEVDEKIEAMDCGKWHNAKIVSVDSDKQEVLVHFNGWGKRFDTIFPMSSALIRGCTQVPKKLEPKFKVGDDVLSQWSDGTYYPGTVISISKTGSYVVMFYDGLKKQVRPAMLKPITEKEKEASLKAAQKAYLQSLETPVASVVAEVKKPVTPVTGFRRYRTSANDREKRLPARFSSDDSSSTASAPKRAKKRKLAHDADAVSVTSQPSSATTSPGGSPVQPERFHAKRARLDKITQNLQDKVTTVVTTSTATVPTVSSAQTENTTTLTSSTFNSGESPTFAYDDSDGSDAPLVIDEDRDKKVAKLMTKKSKPGSSKLLLRQSKTGETSAEENLHQLAEAALSSLSSDDTHGKSPSPSASGKKRKEASEALLQLALVSGFQDQDGVSGSLDDKTGEKPKVENKMADAVRSVLEDNKSLNEASRECDVETVALHEALLSAGAISASARPFMSVHQEDDVINWIHDMTDLGWGISDAHICQELRAFLLSQSYLVMFGDHLSINLPSEAWLEEFFARHPEIFPGRKKPLSRFRCDREGFEDWLVRWLATLRSYNVFPNAVYYCDETQWDATPKLLRDVRFTHASRRLLIEPKAKFTALSCVGANGKALPTFHVFPENSEKAAETADKKDAEYEGNAATSPLGAITSQLFLHWLKTNFVANVPLEARPAALLVDGRLDELDFEVLRFAEENRIILFRFLPTAAHFLQHPDQKLFGRLRQQWKKSLVSKFMKQNASKEVTTDQFAKYFNNEFSQIATPSTIKMCFELTKLYSPFSDAEVAAAKKEAAKEKRNKRKRSKPVAYIEPPVKSKVQLQVEKTPPQDVVPEPQVEKTPQAIVATEEKTVPEVDEMSLEPTIVDVNDPETMEKVSLEAAEATTTTQDSKSAKGKAHPDPAVAAGAPKLGGPYSKGQTVLAKWSDCRLYLATVLKRLDEDRYKVRYFDGLVKTVKDDFLRPWSGAIPTILPSPSPLPKIRSPTAAPTSPKASPAASKSRSKSIDSKPSGATKRRNSQPEEKTKQPRSAASESKQRSRTTSSSSGAGAANKATPASGSDPQTAFTPLSERIAYKRGETVLCRWTDRRMYPATVLKQTDEEHYLVKYYDERKKVVKYTWLSPWKPLTAKQATSLPTARDVTATVAVTSPVTSAAMSPTVSLTKNAALPGGKTTSGESGKAVKRKSGSEAELDLGATPKRPSDAEKSRATVSNSSDTTAVEDKASALGDIPEYEAPDPELTSLFKVEDTVLARWTDTRFYPASVLKVIGNGQYQVQYYDGMKRNVKESFLKRWDPNALPQPSAKSRPRKRATSQNQSTKSSGDDAVSAAEPPALKTPDGASAPTPTLGLAHGHIPKLPAQKDFVTEAEINRFRCRVPGCSKVFRKESVLQQHHRHYHLQRYKLRDQETAPHPKRKTSKDEHSTIKRRVSADYFALSPDRAVAHHDDRGPRSRGGKPPIDRLKINLGTSPMVQAGESSSADDPSSFADTPSKSLDSSDSPQRKKQKRSATPPSGKSPGRELVEDKDAAQEGATSDMESSCDPKIDPSSPSGGTGSGAEVVNEDIIQCVCGDEEENGFMLQCESCLTWQHASCEGISPPQGSEGEAAAGKGATPHKSPEGYVCSTCRNPPGVRDSSRYRYNNDFLNKGLLPSLNDVTNGNDVTEVGADPNGDSKDQMFQHIMLATHQLMEELTKMQETLHGIRIKAQIADPEANHPLLRSWEFTEDREEQEKMSSGIDKDPPSENMSSEQLVKEDVKEKSDAKPESQNPADADPGAPPTGSEEDGDKGILQSVKSALMSLIRAVTGPETERGDTVQPESSPKRDETVPKDENRDQQEETKDEPKATTGHDKMEVVELESIPTTESNKTPRENKELWKLIEIEHATETTCEAPDANRKSGNSRTEDEETTLRSRGNLLRHINHLEACLSDRLLKLEDYVSGVETAFECYRESSDDVSFQTKTRDVTRVKSSPSYDRRLGELRSEIGVIHDDLDAVHKMLFSSA